MTIYRGYDMKEENGIWFYKAPGSENWIGEYTCEEDCANGVDAHKRKQAPQ